MPKIKISISVDADMHEYLLQRKRQDGVPVSTQIQRAIENDILDRAKAGPLEMTSAEFEAKWQKFLAPLHLTRDAGVDYETGDE